MACCVPKENYKMSVRLVTNHLQRDKWRKNVLQVSKIDITRNWIKESQGGDSIAFNFIALIIAPDSSKY